MYPREALISYFRVTLVELTVEYIEETALAFMTGIGSVILTYQVMKYRASLA
jgi:hypothetical protein